MSPQKNQLICDFTGGAVLHRFRFGGGRGQALPKAVGLKNGKTPSVVDATAGLGRDAFLLASLGSQVTLIERSPQMYEILKDGLDRALEAGGDVAEVVERMTLLSGDAKDLLPKLNPEVVLVDPMHPPRKKSALVKNEMRLIRKIVGEDLDVLELMQVALKTAQNRVVLKWPMRADSLAGLQACSHQITGKSTRYDVFMKLD
ncbi:MAG: 16S rRNA methyltransferase [Rhodospirillaceae bacterium]|nr:MAG: 16S rRNA methyltransferase [Rhodospirillaceae bacterium]